MRNPQSLSCYSRVKRSEYNTRPIWNSDYVFEAYVGDRSGSMRSMGQGPSNSTRQFIETKRIKAKKGQSKYHLTCVTFDDKASTVFSKDASKISEKDILLAILP